MASLFPELDHHDRGPGLRVFIIVMMILTFISVVLRFWSSLLHSPDSRGSAPNKLWWDDWSALGAMICIEIAGALSLDMIRLGLGKHTWDLDPKNIVPAMTRLFSIYFLYDATLLLAKASCLLFYTRIFGRPHVSGLFKWAIWATHAFNILWFIGIVFGTIFMCDPVAKNYNPTLPGKCGTTNSLWLGSAVPSVIIDLVLLTLPLPMIWRLRLDRGRKIALLIIFIISYLVLVISVGRLITIVKSKEEMDRDLSYEGVPAFYWQAAESPFTVISVCLPGMFNIGRQVIRMKFIPFASSMSSKLSTLRSNGTTSAGADNCATFDDMTSMENGGKESGDKAPILMKAQFPHLDSEWRADVTGNGGVGRFERPPHGASIRVQKDVRVESSHYKS